MNCQCLKRLTLWNYYFVFYPDIFALIIESKKEISMHSTYCQKTEVMAEHFRQVVSKKIRGKAKAIVVSISRQHAVRYKEEFDKYIKDKGYTDVKTIVAFSGKVIYDG